MLIFTLTVFSRSSVIGGGDVIEKFPKLCNLYQRVTVSSILQFIFMLSFPSLHNVNSPKMEIFFRDNCAAGMTIKSNLMTDCQTDMIVVFHCCNINFLFSSKTILNSTIFDDKYSGDSFAEHQGLEGLKAN